MDKVNCWLGFSPKNSSRCYGRPLVGFGAGDNVREAEEFRVITEFFLALVLAYMSSAMGGSEAEDRRFDLQSL